MITLVGVGHVFDISRQVRQIILENAPVAVGLELDRDRLAVLLARDAGDPIPEPRGFLARFQQRMARDFGVEPGDEMLAGYKAGAEINAKVYLIDMHINTVMMRVTQQLTVRERLGMIGAALASPFIRKKTVERELERFQENEEEYWEEIGRTMPTVKRVMLDERNGHMARALLKLEQEHGSVLAVVGDAHVPGMAKLLPHNEHREIRLKEVKAWKPGEPDSTGGSFTFNAW